MFDKKELYFIQSVLTNISFKAGQKDQYLIRKVYGHKHKSLL